MPTIMTHAALPLLVGAGLGRRIVSRRLLVAGALAAMLPDADFIGWANGIPYDSALGHRGLSHSFAFAVVVGALAAAVAARLHASRWTAFLFVALAMASHGLADTLTNGGHGVMLLWPDPERFFAPWRPVTVSPLGIGRFFDRDVAAILASELVTLVLPAALFGAVLRVMRPRPVDLAKVRS